ncbi:hypothetical protein [Staphylothermus hellenicus]|uniref:Uncharacterized protein n=1 Tax=Staphylothermus hellenicus (strain DSM 12710 / JCM 10830 / BK20S6-10-b1 / P8) TaxID=591019 RepID=D7DBT5_STAHD|nr:hypothetical protein [Staphylothermus hellenicus]ADI31632.1 hypothetical protein Shell_0501 [Staphylothermus hellenicus DSM 12710]
MFLLDASAIAIWKQSRKIERKRKALESSTKAIDTEECINIQQTQQ